MTIGGIYIGPFALISFGLWLALGVLLYIWLKGELTPEKFLSIFESEKALSIRLILAAVWTVFAMAMLAADRIDVDATVKLMYFPEILLLAGQAKVVGKAWAARAPDTTKINAPNAKVDVSGDTTIKTTQPE